MQCNLRLARSASAVVFTVAHAGCTELPAITFDSCGNRVVEVPEQCDGWAEAPSACGKAGTPNACRFICEGGALCPAGWACGEDLRCRLPSGRFDVAIRRDFRAADFDVADVDGDGTLDALGFTRNTIVAAYGPDFATRYSVSVPNLSGPPAMIDMDGDARHDVIGGMSDGVFVLRGRSTRTLMPVPQASIALAEAQDSIAFIPLRVQIQSLITTAMVTLNGNSLLIPGAPSQSLPPNRSSVTFARPAPIARLARTDPVETAVLAFFGVRTLETLTASVTIQNRQIVRVPVRGSPIDAGGPVIDRPHLADINADGQLDIVALVDGPRRYVVAYSRPGRPHEFDNACPWSPIVAGPTPLRLEHSGQRMLAVGSLTPDRIVDLVTDLGVLAGIQDTSPSCDSPEQRFLPATFAQDPWLEAVTSDFNGDGRADVAGVTIDRLAVDLLFGGNDQTFTRRRTLLDDVVLNLRPGDFDGDRVDDLAFIEHRDANRDEVAVLFGARDGLPVGPIVMGGAARILALERMDAVFGTSSLDGVADLLIGARIAANPLRLEIAAARGDANRQMLAPFPLGGFGGLLGDQPIALTAGEFCDYCGQRPGCRPQRDVLVFAQGTDSRRIWVLPGSGEGDPGQIRVTDEVHQQSVAVPPTIDLKIPVVAAADLDADGVDEIVLGDTATTASGLFVVRLASSSTRCIQSAVATRLSLGEHAETVQKIEILDVDGDRRMDVVVTYVSTGRTHTGVLVYFNEGGQLLDAVEVPPPGGGNFVDAMIMRLPEGRSFVATAADTEGQPFGTLWRVPLNGRAFGTPEFIVSEHATGRVRVGDVNRDGLDDLIILDGDSIAVRHGLDQEAGAQ